METTNNGVKKSTSKSAISIARVYVSDFQKEGTMTAELKQTVTTISSYPSKSVSSNLSDNIFGVDDFGFSTQDFTSERVDVAWINVPIGSTVETVAQKLKNFPDATLYRIVGNRPIISDNQQYAIDQGLTTLDNFANSQVIRHGSDDVDGKWAKNDLVIDDLGRPVYKACFLSTTKKSDINNSTEDPADFYASEEIKAEMIGAAVVTGQSI